MLSSLADYDYNEIIHLEQYLKLPSSSLYKKIKSLYKDSYQPNERLVFAYDGEIPYDLLAHLQRCIEIFNIANCFVCICNTYHSTQTLIDEIKKLYSSDTDNTFELLAIDIATPGALHNDIDAVLNPPESMCLRPWTQIYVSPKGIVKPCCVSELFLNTNAKDVSSFTQLYNDQKMIDLREQLLKGDKPTSCNACWQAEQYGKESHRTGYNHTHRDRLLAIDYESNSAENIFVFDLSLGTVCNLACRICNSWSSSKWAAELIASDIDVDQNKARLQAGRWAETNHAFWYEFEKWLPQTEFLDFAGGEPLMNPLHWNVLKLAVDKGFAKNISLRYNTNGTVMPTVEQLALWKQFKHVKIDISIDDIEQRFEYQRHHAKWSDLVHTVSCFKNACTNNMTINASVAINLYNVFYIPELCVWLSQQDFDSVWFNQVITPKHLDITNLTQNASQKVIAKWESIEHDYTDDLAPFRLILQKANGKHLQDFINYTSELDRRRKQRLDLSHKELVDLTK